MGKGIASCYVCLEIEKKYDGSVCQIICLSFATRGFNFATRKNTLDTPGDVGGTSVFFKITLVWHVL